VSTLVVERPSIEAQLARQKPRVAPRPVHEDAYEKFCQAYKEKMKQSNYRTQCSCAEYCTIEIKRTLVRAPADVSCKCCKSCETKNKNNKTRSALWYRWEGLGWYCHRCFYRMVMRKVNKIDPKNYRRKNDA
jgi:hypothetical protein